MNFKIKIFFILTIITLFLSYPLQFLKFTQDAQFNNLIFSIRYDYFGMDAQQIEQTITIPLEQRLFELDNLIEVKSLCQANKSITNITFSSTAEFDATYLQIRKITEQFSNELPSDVQKCQIYMSESSDSSFLCASFNCSKTDLDKYKQLFESINGVSEILINGPEKNTIVLQYSNLKLNKYNISPDDIIRTIQENNSQNKTAKIVTNNSTTRIFLNNKLNKIEEINKLTLNKNSRPIPLSEIINIYYEQSEQNEKILINNCETATLTIKTSSNANWINISRTINKLLFETNIKEYSPVIIYDKGKEQFYKILFFSFQFIILLTILFFITLFFTNSKINSFILITIFLISTLWTLGLLSLVKIKITPQILITLILTVIFLSQIPVLIFYINKENCYLFSTLFKNIFLTKNFIIIFVSIILFFIPFLFIKNISQSLFQSSVTFLFMTLTLFISSLLIIPAFSSRNKTKSLKESKTFKFNININKRYQAAINLTALFAFTFLIITSNKTHVLKSSNDNTISIFAEYNPERSISSLEKELNPYLQELSKIENIKYIKTEFSKGHCLLEIIPQKGKKSCVYKKISLMTERSNLSNIYIPQIKNKISSSIQIAISGSEIIKCQDYAKQFSKQLSETNYVNQIIYNFKESEIQYFIIPDNSFLLKSKTTIKELADNLRINLYGPVISKYQKKEHEQDIKLRSDIIPSINNYFYKVQFKIKNILFNLCDTGEISKRSVSPKINRINSKRCAYITLELKSDSMSTLSKIQKLIDNQKLEEGYYITMNKDFLQTQDFNKIVTINILISIILVFTIISAITENITASIKIISYPSGILVCPLLLFKCMNIQLNQFTLIGILISFLFSIENIILSRHLKSENNKKLIKYIRLNFIIGITVFLILNISTPVRSTGIIMLLSLTEIFILNKFSLEYSKTKHK